MDSGKKIYYGIGIDNSQLQADAARSKSIIKGIGTKFVALGGVIASVKLAKSVYEFAEALDKSMKEVSTLSEEITKNMMQFKKQIISLSTEIPIAADDAAKALYQIVSAGHDGAEGMAILETSAKAAIGGVTDTVTAADAITTVLNAYKMSAEEADAVSDQLFTTVRLGKTTMTELGSSIAQAIPIAAAFGIESEQVLAAVATLTKSGTPTAIAFTQIRAAIQAASEVLGDGYFKVHSFQEGLQEITEKAGGSEAKLRELVPNIRALTGVLGLTGINAKSAASDLNQLENSAGAASAAYSKMADEVAAKQTILKNNFLAEFSVIGDTMVKTTEGVTDALNKAFETGDMQQVIKILGTLIAMYGTYKAVLISTAAVQKVGLIAKQTYEYVRMARALGIATANQIAFNSAMAVNPVVAVSVAVAALVGGLILMNSNADKATKSMQKFNKSLEEGKNSIREESNLVDIAFKRLKNATKGTSEYTNAKKAIIDQYGSYLRGMDDEITSLDNITAAYKKIKVSIEEVGRARALDAAQRTASENLAKIQSTSYDVISEQLKKRYGDQSDEILLKFKPVLEGETPTAEVQKIIDSFDEIKGVYGGSVNQNRIKTAVQWIQDANKELDDSLKKANILFGAKEKADQITEEPQQVKQTSGSGTIVNTNDYQRTVKNQVKKAEFEIRQAKIDAMNESREKELEQINLNYDKLIQTNIEREQDWRKALAESGGGSLSLEQTNALIAYNESAENYRKKAQDDTIKELLTTYSTYFEKRKQLEEKFNKDIELLQQTGHEKEAEMAEQAKLKALAASDEEFAERSGGWDKFITQISNYSLDKLTQVLNNAQDQLKQLEDDGTSDNTEEVIILRAKISELQKKVNELTDKDTDNFDLEQWEALDSQIDRVSSGFTKLGGTIGGAAGDTLKSVGTFTLGITSMISNIVKFTTISSKSIKGVSASTAAAMTAIEKASIVLAILQTAIQLLKELNTILPTSSKEYEAYNSKIQAVNKLVDAQNQYTAAVIASQNAENEWFGDSKLVKLKGLYDLGTTAMENYNAKLKESQAIYQNQGGGGWATGPLNYALSKLSLLAPTDWYQNLLGQGGYDEGTTAAINNLRIETRHKSSGILGSGFGGHSQKTEDLVSWAKKKLGIDLFDDKGLLNNEAYETIMENYSNKLVGETKETLEGLKELKDTYDEYIDQLRDYVSEMQSPLIDAMVDATWQFVLDGKDAMDTLTDYFKDEWENLGKDMLAMQIQKDVFEAIDKDGLTAKDRLANLMDDFISGRITAAEYAEKLKEEQEKETAIYTANQGKYAQITESFGQKEDIDRQATSTGISTASQDSINELNGRMTAVQGHTYQIAENTKMSMATISQILKHTANIDLNTQRLENVETDMRSVKNSLNDINLKGIKIK